MWTTRKTDGEITQIQKLGRWAKARLSRATVKVKVLTKEHLTPLIKKGFTGAKIRTRKWSGKVWHFATKHLILSALATALIFFFIKAILDTMEKSSEVTDGATQIHSIGWFWPVVVVSALVVGILLYRFPKYIPAVIGVCLLGAIGYGIWQYMEKNPTLPKSHEQATSITQKARFTRGVSTVVKSAIGPRDHFKDEDRVDAAQVDGRYSWRSTNKTVMKVKLTGSRGTVQRIRDEPGKPYHVYWPNGETLRFIEIMGSDGYETAYEVSVVPTTSST